MIDGKNNPSAIQGQRKMRESTPKKQALTDAERHARFIAMVGEVEASTDASDFDAAFKALDKRHK